MDNFGMTDIIAGAGRKRPGDWDLGAMRVRVARDQYGLRVGIRRVAIVVAIALLWCNGAQAADTQVYLLRGWFGVFSTGLDRIAAELRAKGINASAIGHSAWESTVSKIVGERAAGKTGLLVLVGHSQGANNVIDMAHSLEPHGIPVDLLITLAPFLQDPIPANVVRAIDYYQSGGWGAPLTAEPGFRGTLSNVDVGDDASITHIDIDKSPRVQAEIIRAITALSRGSAR